MRKDRKHDQEGFIPAVLEWFNICKSINVKDHINKLNNKNDLINSKDSIKAFDNPFMIKKKKKTSQYSRHGGNMCCVYSLSTV